MTTTNTTARLSPRLAGLVAAVIAASEAALSLPANDNAGLAFRIEDDAEYIDDRLVAIEVCDRSARDLASAIAAGVDASWWRVDHKKWPQSAVSLRINAHRWSRSKSRRTTTLLRILEAAGVRAMWR